MKSIYILRSISGAGKSTLANQLRLIAFTAKISSEICSADHFFCNEDGDYCFDANRLGEAHKLCKQKFLTALENKINLIIIDNTNCTESELNFYIEHGREKGYTVFSLIIENRNNTKNIHNVPEITLEKQELKLKNSLKLR